MKIAILFSGRILNYDRYYNNLKKFIFKDNEVDIFLSHSKELNEDLTGFINLYKPKIVIDETIPKYNGELPYHEGRAHVRASADRAHRRRRPRR